MKWGQRSTPKSCLSSKLASFLDRFNNATTRADSGLSPLSSDLSRRCSKLLEVMCPVQVCAIRLDAQVTATHARKRRRPNAVEEVKLTALRHGDFEPMNQSDSCMRGVGPLYF